MTEILVEPTPQSLINPKIIVCKTLLDPTMAKITVEKLKTSVFAWFGFWRPPSERIQQKSIESDYDIYVVADGKYTIDYYRKRRYEISVDEKVQEVVLFDQALKPEPTRDPRKKSVTLEGQERIVRESKACIVLDVKGREISPKRVPSGPSEEHPDKVLAAFKKVKEPKEPPSNGVDLLRSRIVNRPSEVERVLQETFEIVDNAVIYAPVYRAVLQDLRTGKEKTIKIDGVTGRLTH